MLTKITKICLHSTFYILHSTRGPYGGATALVLYSTVKSGSSSGLGELIIDYIMMLGCYMLDGVSDGRECENGEERME